MSDNIVEVAVGVLIREDGRMLLSSRPEGKPYAGYWEFPGGKLEKGETAILMRMCVCTFAARMTLPARRYLRKVSSAGSMRLTNARRV